MKNLSQSMLIVILIVSAIPALSQKWEPFNVGLDSIEINCMTNKNEELFIGTYRNGVFSSNIMFNDWKEINNGIDTFFPGVHSMATVNNTIYAGLSSGLFVSHNNGNSWDMVNDGYLAGYASSSTIMSFFDNMIYSDGCSVFLSENKGQNWSLIGSGGIYRHISSFASSGNGKDIYAGTINGALLSSSDGGKTWEQIHEFPNSINSLTVEANVLIVGTDKGVYLSNNVFDWQTINDGLTNLSARSIIISSKYLFVATNDGVFKAEKSSDIKWTPFNEGLKNLNVCCLTQIQDYLFAATSTGSVYKLDLTALSVDDATKYNNITIHPNPAMEYITIQTSEVLETSEVSEVKIYNMLGECVNLTPHPSKGSGSRNLRIDVSYLPRGVYYLCIGSQTQMFVKV